MTSVSSDDHDCLFGTCCDRSKFVDRKSSSSEFEILVERVDRYESAEDSEIKSESIHETMMQTGVIKAFRKDSEAATDDIASGDDETLLNNRATYFREGIFRDVTPHESTTSDDSGNASPPPHKEVMARYTQTFRSAASSKKVCNGFSLGCTDPDSTGRHILPCIYGKQYNLLTDSLNIIAQHSNFDSDEPKNISLTLPFGDCADNCSNEALHLLGGTHMSKDSVKIENSSGSTYSPPHLAQYSIRDGNPEMSSNSPQINPHSKGLRRSPTKLSPVYKEYHTEDLTTIANVATGTIDRKLLIKRRRPERQITLGSIDTDLIALGGIFEYKCNHVPSVGFTGKGPADVQTFPSNANKKTGSMMRSKHPLKLTKKRDRKKKRLPTKYTMFGNSTVNSIIITLAGLLLNNVIAKELILAITSVTVSLLMMFFRILAVLVSVVIMVVINRSESLKQTVVARLAT